MLILCISWSQAKDDCEARSQQPPTCGLWLAESSIPHAGIGMYAGRSYEKKEALAATGDVVIPIVDINFYHGSKFNFLWDSYTWGAAELHAENEGIDEVNMASPGFGAAANCFLELLNVDEWRAHNDNAGLHRSRDPGAGAFSPYHNRTATAKTKIEAGQELFVDYGENYFQTRAEELGPVPLRDDLGRGSKLLKGFESLRRKYNESHNAIFTDFWETFVLNTSFADSSRVIFGLPKDWEETEDVLKRSGNNILLYHRVEQSTRSLAWLEENGICADNIREGVSTIPQAGRGAFATRNLANGSAIAPLPLIHVTERRVFDMYERTMSANDGINEDNVVSKQLLLNYCFGHRQSTLLLCPYGMLAALVNHGGREAANVRLQWSDPTRSSHNPTWLNLSVKDLKRTSSSGLSLELVALRDIKEGEEVLLDYGDEWENAWKNHVDSWEPLEGAADYMSARDLNADVNNMILRTEFEQIHYPYPANVQVQFDNSFRNPREWQNRTDDLLLFKQEYAGAMYGCEILNRTEASDARVLYTIVYTDLEGDETDVKVAGIPREAFEFKDRAYTSDFLQENVFRHDIRLPDDLMPEAWKNVALQFDIDWTRFAKALSQSPSARVTPVATFSLDDMPPATDSMDCSAHDDRLCH